MYLTLSRLDFILGLILFPVWLAAALLVRRQAGRPSAGRARRTARIALAFMTFALLATAAKAVVFVRIASLDWEFVSDRRAISTLALLVPAALVTLVVSLPRVVSAARRRPQDRDAALTDAERGKAASVRAVLPPQITAVASLAGFFEKFLPPHRSTAVNLAVAFGVLALVTALLAVRARGRAYRLSQGIARARRPAGRVWGVRLGTAVVALGAVFGLVTLGLDHSRLPGTFSMMQGEADYGGGPAGHRHMAGGPHLHGGSGSAAAVSVDSLKGPRAGKPDRVFTLTAQEKKVRLASGRTFTAWTYNGQIPGPELRVKEGELVEIRLTNKLPGKTPVTIHWHGLDVPNGEDGVAGATQDAVQPGQSYTYRFRVDESGTRWYHSHQQASEQVKRGLFGPLVIEPAKQARPVDHDVTVVAHDWETPGGTYPAFGSSDTLERRTAKAGEKVRLRLVNSSNLTKTFALTGVPFRVTALDGTGLNRPGEIKDKQLVVGGAQRMDVEFTMPASPVRLTDSVAAKSGIVFSPDGRGTIEPRLDGPEFDVTGYGEPTGTPFGTGSEADRDFKLTFDDWLGFYNGRFGLRQTINGKVFPDAPMLMVKEGDLVRTTFVNRGEEDHPIHLHGHHMLVLSKNGRKTSGSPVWLDTINVRPGDRWQVAFKADNPGIWMDHCHNFVHTGLGMVMHLTYEGVTTPYAVGGAAHNRPE
ncbi:multicopper oxidase domain-containing protein [Streptomyces sp. NBC_00829]|uniref:multicopper oxidase domain-containing protein n=1 Tax=Streptomyces sp. NBC_00829 TaxID=2903679 RepID=UPI0038649A2B|nr:multicopper oxidase family protein [Streptomyces sp. NBC_00829]